jgi:tetrahydrodipicolinate N-succinyltransferase
MKKTVIQDLFEWLDRRVLITTRISDTYLEMEKQQMIKLANHLRNNYQPITQNNYEWQRIKDKEIVRIEDIINEIY